MLRRHSLPARTLQIVFSLFLFSVSLSTAFGQAPPQVDAEKLEFFESRIRPVLVERCYSCHNSSDTAEADLTLDHRGGIRKQTEHGVVVTPTRPDKSLLLKVIRHEIDGLEMPEGDAKLDPKVIADFETWIQDGAVDPRDQPPSADELAAATSWETLLEKRKQWWSLLPLQDVDPPNVDAEHPIDRFILKQVHESGLLPSERADPATVLRRLTFVITGLPPSPEQIEKFRQVESSEDYERFVDELLDSAAFGERWARHFMDLVRYTDSHGSEGDPTIPHAYRYRDYLIRALNRDVPYDQLLREHIAGDLLADPRLNSELGINESAIGTAHWRMVFHGFAPTDALDEKVRFVDDQINVFSKAFLGLTVSCARCHNHKFDAISQTDYYAMFGILASCRPALIDANAPDRQRQNQNRLRSIKRELRTRLAKQWMSDLDQLSVDLRAPSEELQTRIGESKSADQLLNVWFELQRTVDEGKPFGQAWEQVASAWKAEADAEAKDRDRENRWEANFADNAAYQQWFGSGNGLPPNAIPAGDFRVALDGPNVVRQIMPASVHSASLSDRHRGFLASPRLNLDDEYRVYFRLAGEGNPSVRYSVQHYPRSGTVYPIRSFNHRNWQIANFDLKYWTGDDVHFELATAKDAPIQVRGDARSWFGIREVIVRKRSEPGIVRNNREYLSPLFTRFGDKKLISNDELSAAFVTVLRDAIVAWRDRQPTDEQALLLDRTLEAGLLSNQWESTDCQSLVEEYRRLESDIPEPYRVPGLAESKGWDHALFERGDHRRPSDTVKRRFLEAIDNGPITSSGSGRLELAEKVLANGNPLPRRVIANRLWHYVFGEGLVRTPDNFGRLGDKPTHPELLDYLARRFEKDGWSIKQAIRLMVTSQTWQASSVASTKAKELDPENRLWSHALIRRLEAEAIRDALLHATGRLERQTFGPTVGTNGRSNRRSVYVAVRRNALDQFLHAFDAPVPFATTGRRDSTNVPAQSLTMLNDPFVKDLASAWAAELKAKATDEAAERNVLRELMVRTLTREPTAEELASLSKYLRQVQDEVANVERRRRELQDEEKRWVHAQAALIDPIRESIKKSRSEEPARIELPTPLLNWDFSEGLTDRVRDVAGTLKESAEWDNSAIVLRGNGYFASPPIDRPLGSKTLVADVLLESLDQRGGGVLSVQTLNGVIFDAIVFGERRERHWIAGSNSFVRTEDLEGAAETAQRERIQMAIAYDANGTIRAYRNGKPYGRPTRKSGLQKFNASDWQVLVGLRHASTGRLSGKVVTASVYDRALTEDEIASLALGASYISQKDLLDAMTETQRQQFQQNNVMLQKIRTEYEELREPPKPGEAWARLVHAVLNLKEFIYLR